MTATYDGQPHDQPWENLRPRQADRGGRVNISRAERWISVLAGAALVAYGVGRKRLRGVLLLMGGGLIARGLSGHCPISQAIGRNTAEAEKWGPATSIGRGRGIRVEQAVTIARPREELYRFWRSFENLPRFMDHLESVSPMGGERSHWMARGPAGTRVEWDAEIHNEIENELIAWRSLPSSDVDSAGSVHFEPAPGGGTTVRVILRYDPPAGVVGAAVAKLFGENPERQVQDDLRRLKQVMEAGEVGTPDGSAVGQPW
jgi:uncharacterized membrane protein